MPQLALDQGLRWPHPSVLAKHRKSHRCSHLRRRQPSAFSKLGSEAVAHLDATERILDQRFAGSGRRAFELQVILEAASERRIDLLDPVGRPDHRYRVGLENLVDPGLAADTAAAAERAVATVDPRHDLRRIGRDRRKYILDLVEQQCHLRTGFQEYLADLQRPVTIAPRQRVAVAIGIFDLVQRQPGGLRGHLRQFGLASSRRSVQQDVDAGLLAQHGMAQQRRQHLQIVGHIVEIGRGQLACVLPAA